MVEITLGTALAAIGAGVAIGFAGLGSGLGQGMAAAGSVGAVAEDNDMFARGIIFSALPETQAIYGFLIAILLLVFSGLLGTGKPLSIEAGIVAIGVGASIGFAGTPPWSTGRCRTGSRSTWRRVPHATTSTTSGERLLAPEGAIILQGSIYISIKLPTC